MELGKDKLLDGSKVADKVEADISQEVDNLQEQGIYPTLAVILAGHDPASQVYVSYKEKACERVGIESRVIDLPDEVTEEEVLAEVEALNDDEEVDGILVQLPLPDSVENEDKIIKAVDPEKDVDGFHPENVGELTIHGTDLAPCTPKGIMEIMERYNIDLEGKDAVVIGRSNIVGKPLATMLRRANATVTTCHSRTKNLKAHTKRADLLAVAIGKPEYITADMVKEDAIVIDIGTNRTEDGVTGDVDFEDVIDKVQAITPVPGGVGPMTIATLLENTLIACRKRRGV